MLNSEERQVIEAVSPARVAETCSALVRIPTVNPYSGDRHPSGEMQGQLTVEKAMRQLDGQTERLDCIPGILTRRGVLAPEDRIVENRPNIIGKFRFGNGGGPVILLDAHIDTVAVDSFQGDPFAGRIADGFVYGRGTSDDKGGVAAILEAMQALTEAPGKCSGTVICCSVVEEECDGAGRGSLSCIDHVVRPDAAIVVDGGSGGVWSGSGGVATAEITVHGLGGHAAGQSGANAIEKAAGLLPALGLFREKRAHRPGSCNLGVFQAGDHPANVPTKAKLGLNLKTWPEDMQAAVKTYGECSGRTVRDLFEQCIHQAVSQNPELAEQPPQIRWIKDVPAALCGDNCRQLLEQTAAAFSDVTGAQPPIAPLGGWGDISHFILAGIPCAGLGVGHPGCAHSPSERVAVADLAATARILALTVHRLLRQNLR